MSNRGRRRNTRVGYEILHPEYNWKQHSTGWLLGSLRGFYVSDWDDDWTTETDRLESNLLFAAVKDELAKRPHMSTKQQRRKLDAEIHPRIGYKWSKGKDNA